jgi:predicted HNH restriction endonuclease
MKNHTKVYLQGMRIPITMYFEDLGVMCEWCEMRLAVDINHLDPRKMGGSKLRDSVKDLMAMCRECHKDFEEGKLDEEAVREKHLKNIPQ